MRRSGLVSLIAVAVLASACTGAGSGAGGYGGAYGVGAGSGASVAPAGAASSAPASSIAPAATSSGSGTGSGKSDYGTGGGKGDYGPGGSSPAAVGSVAPGTVQLVGYAFAPTAISAAAGSSLTFVNGDTVAHDIVEGSDGTPAVPAAFHVRVDPGASATVTLPTAGALKVTCTIHPSMNLAVTVTP